MGERRTSDFRVADVVSVVTEEGPAQVIWSAVTGDIDLKKSLFGVFERLTEHNSSDLVL